MSAGPFHSQSPEAWFFHTPGLKIVAPSTPFDAKGLLNSSIQDPNPVLYFEHKYMYSIIKVLVPNEYYNIEIGKGAIKKLGTDLSVITYGMGVHWALDFIEKNDNISIDLLELRTLVPLDVDAIKKTVLKTGKILILHEDTHLGGFGADIASLISENFFEYLDAPIFRVSSLDTPVPFASSLESNYLANKRLSSKISELYSY